MNYRIEKGKEGELFVVNYLKQHGYTILTQNYRKRYGEVDIIAQKKDLISFIEVKWRNNPLIDPAELIVTSKQKKIVSIAKEFISKHTNKDFIYRFDVALIEKDTNHTIHLHYIPNAFTTFD